MAAGSLLSCGNFSTSSSASEYKFIHDHETLIPEKVLLIPFPAALSPPIFLLIFPIDLLRAQHICTAI